ncbi:hypothetical protein DD237_000700 [Peronospora effusa]|uniref:SCP domain-containing protein n=1 Tax=Peronospora effusa TaxID=542832 RepID=A0A3R7XZW3_9STRA|nr:hypothetical protein DD237_000700 [Peronospora effusa]
MKLWTTSVLFLLVATASGSLRRLQTYTQTSDYEALMLERVNLERSAQGLPLLCINKKLQLAAQGHSDDQAANNFMDHTGSNGSTPAERVSAAGYDWRGVAENVAAGQVDVTEVMDAWMNSEGHRHNILGDYTMLGSAYAYTSNGLYKHFWTQNFGQSDTELCDGMTATTTRIPSITSPTTTDQDLNATIPQRNKTMSAPNRREPRGFFPFSCSNTSRPPSLHLAIVMITLVLLSM